MNKWLSLFSSLEVEGKTEFCCNEEDFKSFEAEIGIRLPKGYKEFCTIFGTGTLGGFIRIYCPCKHDSKNDVQENQWNVTELKDAVAFERDSMERGFSSFGDEKFSMLERLLENAFAFGDNPNAEVFLWDLSSYNESDKSYDIYIVPFDDLRNTTLVGRDFFEFVSEFCLTSKSDEILPPKLRFYEDENVTKSFLRF
jgi:hypothetical protein